MITETERLILYGIKHLIERERFTPEIREGLTPDIRKRITNNINKILESSLKSRTKESITKTN